MLRSAVRRPLAGVLMVMCLVSATGCLSDWAMFGNDASNTRSTSDSGVTAAGLPTLSTFFKGTTGGAISSSPSVAAGVAFVTSDDGKLDAFDAAGVTNCSNSPNTCRPLWTATLQPAGALASATLSSSPVVAGGIVYVGSTTGQLLAFDATGTTHCAGSPKTCTPLWTASPGGSILSSPVVSGGDVYVGSTNGTLYAYDGAGSTNCASSVCSPLWTGATGGAIEATAAVANGLVYIGSGDGKLYAFDAAGAVNCSGTVCAPRWTGTAGPITFSSPAVSGGSVFVGSTNGKLYAFGAAGTTNCAGSPVVCTPAWTVTTGGSIVSSPAVAAHVVYVGSSDHKLYALDASGAGALWTATTSGVVRSSPAVANGLVFVGSDDHLVRAYSADGTTSCAGSPKTCTSMWSATTGAAVASSPIVAQGAVYFGSLDSGLYAERPWVFSRPACPANTHGGLSPCQLQDAYELPSAVTGAGRTVAIVDAFDDPNVEPDLAAYRTEYGLPPCTTANGCFTKLNQSGLASGYPTADVGWSTEISLDVDTVSAACPLCHITLVEANSNSGSDLAAAEAIAAATHPSAISNSWGGSEFGGEHTLDGWYTFPGIPVTFSTGDSGYGTSWPAAVPAVTAVGGTQLTPDGSARGWAETAWSGAGSGCSTGEPKAAWQTDPGCGNRSIADVSALAGYPGLAIYDTYGGPNGWAAYGGTSLASPIVASVYALASPVATASYTYAHTASLFDITSGANGTCGGSYLCTAVTGYDGPTGLGTPCGTAAFGTGPFATNCAAGGGAAPAAQSVSPDEPVVLTPVCGPPAPGFATCHADRIDH